jgi:hypothetical protein
MGAVWLSKTVISGTQAGIDIAGGTVHSYGDVGAIDVGDISERPAWSDSPNTTLPPFAPHGPGASWFNPGTVDDWRRELAAIARLRLSGTRYIRTCLFDKTCTRRIGRWQVGHLGGER